MFYNAKDKVIGKRGINNLIKTLKSYKLIIFVLIFISILSVGNGILIYKYAVNAQEIFYSDLNSNNILIGNLPAEIDNVIKNGDLESAKSTLITAKKHITTLIEENEKLLADNIQLQAYIDSKEN